MDEDDGVKDKAPAPAIPSIPVSKISVFTVFLLGTVGFAMLGDRTTLISLGPVSGLGLLTGIIALAGLLLLVLRPIAHQETLGILWPLISFWFYDAVATLWSPLILPSIQDTVVWGGFLFLALLAAREVRRRPETIQFVFRVFDVATYGLLAYSLYLVATGAKAAAIPLLLLLLSCYHLAQWRITGSQWGLVAASAFFITNIVVGARTPAGIGAGLYVLAELMMGTRKQWGRIFGIGAVVIGFIVAVWFSYPPLRRAFLGGDNALSFGGVAINTAGRIHMWQMTIESYLAAPWVGLGIDAPPDILYAGGQGHPHNDYLRILHHLGAVGLLLWLVFYGRTMYWVWRAWKTVGDRIQDILHAKLYATTFMSMVAMALAMVTDNTIVYAFLMYPLSVLIGLSVGSFKNFELK
jgi:O-antigen ligase